MPAQNHSAQKLFFLSISGFLVSLILLLALTPKAFAQGTITAIPPRLDLQADPGQTVTASLKVRNDADIQQLFTISVDDFIVTDTIGTPIPVSTSSNNRWSLKNWISAPEFIPVDAHGTQVIKISIKVPLTGLPGGHYAMITYQPHGNIKPADLKTTGNFVAQRVGTLVYLQVTGPIVQNANVIKFATEKFHEQGPVEFAGSIQNLSDIHIDPKGTISIFSPFNTKVADIQVDAGNIFPEVIKDFSATWNQKWGYGRYRAELNLAYGTAGGVLTAVIFFWLFPIRLVIYSLVGIVSILIVIILLNRRNKHHQQELEKEVSELKKELEQVENK